jgi:hypothetical protein
MQLHLGGSYSPLDYLRLKVLAVRKRRRLLELTSLLMVDIALSLLVTHSTGILVA